MKRIKGQLSADAVLDFGCAHSPYGEVMIAWHGGAVCFLTFTAQGGMDGALAELKSFWPEAALRRDDRAAGNLAAKIFAGSDVEIAVRGTDMQARVWEALISVPAGTTLTYTDLAAMAGYPHAVRAVASAVARNPVPVAIPCHRVVRKSGEIGNFRYGTPMKKAMLDDEMAG